MKVHQYFGVHKKLGKNYIPLVVSIFGILIFGLLFNNVRQQEVNIQEGQLAEKTIRANKTVENRYETKEKQRLAMEAVTPEYSYDDHLASTQVSNLNQLFSLILKVNKDTSKDASEKVASLKNQFESLGSDKLALYQNFPQSFYDKIFTLSDSQIQSVQKVSTSIVGRYMKDHIRQNTLSNTKQNAMKSIPDSNLSSTEIELIKIVVNEGIVVNEVSNQKRTNELKEEAKNSVKPVMIYQGEIIVREGAQIDAQAMQKLKLLGLTNKAPSLFPLEALLLAIVLQIILLYYSANQIKNEDKQRRFVTFYTIMMLLSVVIMKFLQLFQMDTAAYIPFLFPIAFAPLVLNIFISRRTAIMAAMFQAIFSMFVFYNSIGTSSLLVIVMTFVITGLLASLVKRKRIGRQLWPAFLWLILFPSCFGIMMMIYQGMDFTQSITWMTLLCMTIGTILSFILSIGLHPYIELLLTDDSEIVLNELSNPNHPLLKKLLEEAPGTYHHSMMVANLSANAVAAIGGNAMVTRVGCYYHDIGKTKHANFFVENLPAGAENPHNFLLPEDSKQIIFSHVIDGAKMLREYHMPQAVVDICEQHHGTTLMRYFYVEAKERNPEVTEEEFRYPGPKPQTKEAAVVSIADSSEAAIRAMGQPTQEKIADFVHDLINSRIEDGQFDECGITMRELRIVEQSIVNGLYSSFHTRIQYPKLEKEDKNEGSGE